jgi:ureidoacrylate peracid hydrolase
LTFETAASYSDEMMHAALDINMPNYARAIVGTEEIVASISALRGDPRAAA